MAHTHDTSVLRAGKPVLDAEDRIVYFFGVGPRACHVRSTSGPAPNLQLCVAHEDDVTTMACLSKEYLPESDLNMAAEFKHICREFHLVEENIMRAEKNSCFHRACEEAMQFKSSVHSDEEVCTLNPLIRIEFGHSRKVLQWFLWENAQACSLFLTFLVNSKKASRSSSALYPDSSKREVVRAQSLKSSPMSSPSRCKQPQEQSSSSPRLPIFSPPQSKLTKALTSSPSPSKKVLPGLELIAAKCWQHMLEDGWETMTQADGQVLYKMPGISFFNFRPNENIFDSLAKACVQYLTDWTQSASSGNEDEQSKLIDCMWPMVEASGWVKISSSNETWYMMPNTPFNRCVPNVTIFRSKSLAISKYLEMSGVIQVAEVESVGAEKPQNSSKLQSKQGDGNQEVDECMEGDASEEDTGGHSSSEIEGSGEESDEHLDESEDEEVVEAFVSKAPAVAKNAKAVSRAKAKVSNSKVNSARRQPKSLSVKPVPQKLKFDSKPKVSTPPFKCTFGKVEGELRARGWYWKPSAADWAYYMPSCRLKDTSTLTANVDFFPSRAMLEDYLDASGLYDDIRDKLRRDHEQQYSPSSRRKIEDQDVPRKVVQRSEPVSSGNALPQRTALKSMGDDNKENQSSNAKQQYVIAKPQRRSAASRSSSSKRNRNSMKLDASSVKFGEIWSALSEKGWHFKPGKLEYDYFKPHCLDARDGVVNVDYFPSKSILIEYLESSGLWDKMARQIANEDPIDVASIDGDGENARLQKSKPHKQVVVKRKSSVVENDCDRDAEEDTPKGKSASKKLKTATFNTPTEQKRCLVNDTPDHEMEQENEKISPDAAGSKSALHDSSAGSKLPRNLADCFTPSPGNSKKGKTSSTAATKSGPHELFSEAIRKLTLGYSPSTFQHREEECRHIFEFFQTCFSQRRGSSMYISGAPGCGKSALLKASEDPITQLYQVRRSFAAKHGLCRCANHIYFRLE